MNDLDHGNYSTYYNKKCRCDLCKAAASAYRKSLKAKGLEPGDKRHGSVNGYFGWGCRCDLCSAAMGEYVRSDARRTSQRTRNLRDQYEITPEQWDQLFKSQGGKCASCGDVPPEDAKRRFHVDHNHDTGSVRGILCHSCNVALGHLKESHSRIRSLLAYLDHWEPEPF